jgi:PAS domain S-box-containing protein
LTQSLPSAEKTRPRRRLDFVVRAASIVFALVVVAATLSHMEQLWRAVEVDVAGRTGTLARILSKEVGRTFATIQLQFDAVAEPLKAMVAKEEIAEANALLVAQTIQNDLLREVALVDSSGRVVASSSPGHVGMNLAGRDFLAAPGDGNMKIGQPVEGRSFAPGANVRQGAPFARTGYLPVSKSIGTGPGSPVLVAVVGVDSLLNEMNHLAGDDLDGLSIFRYDGQLLAANSDALLQPREAHPIFQDFIPAREKGSFTDRAVDGSRWIAHFDTADDFPVVVETRTPQSVVRARWQRELIEPLVVMGAILIAIFFYTRLISRSLKRQEESVQKVKTQERRLRNILDTAADAIVTIDQRGVIREYNLAAETLFQMPAAEAVGRPLTDLLPPEMAGHQAYLERYLATGRATVIGHGRVLQTRRRDGKPMVVNLAVSEVVDQGERYFTGIVRDVTGLQEAEERFRTLFQRSGEPHLLFDQTGLVDCNDAATELLGAGARGEILGMSLADLAAPAQGPNGRPAAEVLEGAEADARREGVRRLEWTARTVAGTPFPVEMTLTPIRLADKDAMLVAWHDIAERQRYEQELRAARDAAEAAALAKASFLAMMSHELRTPMTGIIGMIELLAESPMTGEQKRFVGALDGSAQSLLRVLNDVLDYSKIEAGRLDLEAVDFDPVATARDVIELLGNAASRRGNDLRADWDAESIPRLRGDPTRLRQLLVNLVGNAIKFTERGRVTLSIHSEPPGRDGLVPLRFEVRDTGVGIPPEVLPTLFRPFQQADSSTTRRFGGTGLGLAICRRLVDAMGGVMGVDSQPGQGSTFWFELELPRAEGQADLAPKPVLQEPAARGLRILVAEDNGVNRLLISTRLRRAEHRVTLVEDGVKAVEAARGQDFDLILMDMQMPELDGAGATREIRRLPGSRGRVPIVALTADALPEFRERYMQSGLDDYLTKPVDWDALDRVLLRFVPDGSARQTPIDQESVESTRASLGAEIHDAALALFWDKAAADLEECGRSAAAGDAGARQVAAQSLNGSAACLGFESLARMAARIEHSKPSEVAGLVEQARSSLAGLRARWAPGYHAPPR